MFLPATRQHVRVRNFSEEFVVLLVDHAASTAFVVSIDDKTRPREVPLTDLLPCDSSRPPTS